MENIDIVSALSRWTHFMAGIMWIGLLYYFNFVQVAALKNAGADGTAAGITKHVAPRALLFFRWAAVLTWISGAALLGPYFMDAFLLRNGMGPIGIGAWLGTIMLFNVWVLIWPNRRFWACCRRPTMRRTRHAGWPSWPRAPTPCCRFRCCSSWQPGCLTRRFSAYNQDAA